jgi:hypothetical protein
MPVLRSIVWEEVDWVAWPPFGRGSDFDVLGRSPPSKLKATFDEKVLKAIPGLLSRL